MKRQHLINIIIVLMSVSLILIIAMQTRLLLRSYNEKKQIVDRGVNEALSLAINNIERQDALMFVYEKMNSIEEQEIDSTYPIDPYMLQSSFDPNRAQIWSNNFQISITSSIGGATHVFTFGEYTGDPFNIRQNNDMAVLRDFFEIESNNPSVEFSDIIEQLEREYRLRSKPIEKRFDAATIQNIINKSLMQKGLALDFEFAIFDGKQNIRLKSDLFDEDIKDKAYHINLAPGNLFDNPDELYVFFPTKERYVLQGIYAQLISSIIFTLIIIITFAITLYTVLRQKKLSEIKNDFINNMTHEFKTPIATIRLAADSIRNPKMIQNPESICNFTNIITQETQRMNHHVEQVLQMALLEKQGVKVKVKPEDMHELINDAVHNIELIIGERKGTINTDFQATEHIVNIDKDTMYNVLSNLLDNANKYSPEKLEVDIRTYNKNDFFIFEVQDQGLGMSKEVQSHIFDRFYRANTGNVHNIKGFGLGLNYVKEIITAHNGQIKVRSAINKGSTFIVYLPMKKKK